MTASPALKIEIFTITENTLFCNKIRVKVLSSQENFTINIVGKYGVILNWGRSYLPYIRKYPLENESYTPYSAYISS